MALLLLQLGAFPSDIAATKLDACVEGGAFFLDFSRPIERLRWFGAWNRRIGFTMSLIIPVVHQGEHKGRQTVIVDRGDPYFAELQRLWAQRYPATTSQPAASPATAARVAADFTTQFPADATHNDAG